MHRPIRSTYPAGIFPQPFQVQVIAGELDLPPMSMDFLTADTGHTPDEGLTAGSHCFDWGSGLKA